MNQIDEAGTKHQPDQQFAHHRRLAQAHADPTAGFSCEDDEGEGERELEKGAQGLFPNRASACIIT